MHDKSKLTYTAFAGSNLLISGPLDEVTLEVKRHLKVKPKAAVLVFSDTTGKQMDLDLSGSEAEIKERLKTFIAPKENKSASETGRGRPRLGVVAREISLLPRHWEWLATQPEGASAAIRKLIEEARKTSSPREKLRESQERTYKFMTTMAGDLPHYEEALRALYSKEKARFLDLIKGWPKDIQRHTMQLASPVWESK